MKRQIIFIFIGIWMAGALLLSVSPVRAEDGEALSRSIRPVQTERDLAADPSSARITTDKGGGRVHLNSALRFEAGRHKSTQPERQAEALRLHRNTLLDRFQNADAHGQVLLTFSENRIDLNLRSITGAEAPIAGVTRSPEK